MKKFKVKVILKNGEPKMSYVYLEDKVADMLLQTGDMEVFKPRIDKIVQMLLATEERARKANRKFYTALAIREAEIRNICGKDYALSNKNVKPADMESNLPK